jgi:hypothetical protein
MQEMGWKERYRGLRGDMVGPAPLPARQVELECHADGGGPGAAGVAGWCGTCLHSKGPGMM